MRKLYLLGSPELFAENDNIDQSFLTGPKRLGLLAYMVLESSGNFIRRDTLLPLFWPTSDQKSARNALSNILYHLRQSLGSDVVVNRGYEEIKIGELWCDVEQFEIAIKKQNHEEALELYRGGLLEGFHISGVSSKFQQWLDLERQRLSQKYLSVLKRRAKKAEQQGNLTTATELWEQCRKEAPLESSVIRKLMISLAAKGKKSKAMQIGKDFAKKLEKELGADADEEFKKLTEDLEKSATEIRKQSEKQVKEKEAEDFELNLETYALNEEAEDYINAAIGYLRLACKSGLNADLSKRQELYKEALQEAYKARQNQPEATFTHFIEGLALYHLKRYSEALFAFEEAEKSAGAEGLPKTKVWAVSAVTQQVKGNTNETKQWLEQLKANSDQFAIGLVYASLDKFEQAEKSFAYCRPWSALENFIIRYLFPEILGPIRRSATCKQDLERSQNK